jgi:hypothetical protein
MFSNVALDVVIGLVFIYLLYSLLATVLSEIIATRLSLRARNLKEAIERMLTDEKDDRWLTRLTNSLKLWRSSDHAITNNFYNHPEIKYLGRAGLYKFPSTFKAISFSKTLLNVLFGDSPLTKELIDAKLSLIAKTKDEAAQLLDPETAMYINMLWTDSYGDIVKFKLQLEAWFDRTMEQATEWYKRKIQVVLMILGFLMAWCFNADTFVIVSKLSTDKDAREKIVSMANAYVQNNKTMVDTVAIRNTQELQSYSQKLDSLLNVKRALDEDIAQANSLLAMGSWLPDVVVVHADPKTGEKLYTPRIDASALLQSHRNINEGEIRFSTGNKWGYFFRLFPNHFFGFLVTAIAISLGAPFWFDLLNKLMRLRTSPKQEINTAAKSGGNGEVSPVNREG